MLDPSASSVSPQSQHPNVLSLQHEEIEAFKNQHSLCTAAENGQIDVVRSLLEQGADVDEMDSLRQTALAVASINGKLQVAELLIEHGADVNSRDADGWTPLHMASQYGHLDVVRLLLDHNADLNASSRNLRTALDVASHCGHLEIVELLLRPWCKCERSECIRADSRTRSTSARTYQGLTSFWRGMVLVKRSRSQNWDHNTVQVQVRCSPHARFIPHCSH